MALASSDQILTLAQRVDSTLGAVGTNQSELATNRDLSGLRRQRRGLLQGSFNHRACGLLHAVTAGPAERKASSHHLATA
jgi:hypothetical protein